MVRTLFAVCGRKYEVEDNTDSARVEIVTADTTDRLEEKVGS